jgi:hypothetical protein
MKNLEVCETRGPMQKYYYDLIPICGNTILAEKKNLTNKQNDELQRI